MEVLESLVLLSENLPFIFFVAIDPRIIVTAVETSNETYFDKCGVNGYEYLDKIVQVRKDEVLLCVAGCSVCVCRVVVL